MDVGSAHRLLSNANQNIQYDFLKFLIFKVLDSDVLLRTIQILIRFNISYQPSESS